MEGISVRTNAPSIAQAHQAAAVLNEGLGDGYVSAAGLTTLVAGGGVLVRATAHSRLIGAGTARILSAQEAKALRNKLPAESGAILAGHRVGELKSAAVMPAERGRGIGSTMLQKRLEFLKAAGCRVAITASWVSADTTNSSIRLLGRAGFTPLASVPGYWAEDQAVAGYDCPDCGNQCRCVAIIMWLDLGEWRPASGSGVLQGARQA